MSDVDLSAMDASRIPSYSLRIASRHAHVPIATLRHWVGGRDYVTANGKPGHARPLIDVPASRPRFLSFLNLVEAHVLGSVRRKHELPMHEVQKALAYLEQEMGVKHPLATAEFQTDAVDLFVARIDRTSDGRREIRAALKTGLSRIAYERGLARRLFPWVRADESADQPKLIVIDPRLAFGRPVLAGTAIPAGEVACRFRAGDSLGLISEEFGVPRAVIEEAIRAAA